VKLILLFLGLFATAQAATTRVYFKNEGGPAGYVFLDFGGSHTSPGEYVGVGQTVYWDTDETAIAFVGISETDDYAGVAATGWATAAWSGSRYPAFPSLDGTPVGVVWDSTSTWWTWVEPWEEPSPFPTPSWAVTDEAKAWVLGFVFMGGVAIFRAGLRCFKRACAESYN